MGSTGSPDGSRSDSFERITRKRSSNEISVEELSGGLLIHHHGKACYFVREACFWPFVFKVAGFAENEVSDTEVRLAA